MRAEDARRLLRLTFKDSSYQCGNRQTCVHAMPVVSRDI